MVKLNAGKPDTRAYIMKAVVPPNHRQVTRSYYITSSNINGRQAWAQSTMASQAELYNIGTQLAGQSGSSAVQQPARYLLEHCKLTSHISNFSQAPCRLVIYHVKMRRDTQNNMVYTTPDATAWPWTGGAISAIQIGVESTVQGGSASTPLQWYVPGILPTESPIFNKYFQIQKETHVMMSQGATHVITTDKHFDKVMDATVYGNSLEYGLVPLTEFVVYRVEGVTGYQPDVPATNSLCPVQVGVYETIEYSFRQVQQSNQYLAVQDLVGANANEIDVQSASTGTAIKALGMNPAL